MAGPLIGTHSGQFHADEALAVYMLRMLPAYKQSPLVRTRDPDTLKGCHTVVDVGGQYDTAAHRYDHHQREFATTFPGHGTKLSSAGLVYMHLGKAIIAQQSGLAPDSDDVELVYQKLYTDFIEAFDANDNGVSKHDPAALDAAHIPKRFEDRGFSIAAVVGRMNYPGDADPAVAAADAAATPEQRQAAEDARFEAASAFTGGQFAHELARAHRSWLPARAVVKQAFGERGTYDAAGRIIVLPHRDGGLPWEDHLYALEEAAGVAGTTLYALFAESGEPGAKWRVRAVSAAKGSFETRKPLPAAWRGVRDEELSRVAGIPGCVFAHASGFIGGNVTFEGALKMAQVAVDLA